MSVKPCMSDVDKCCAEIFKRLAKEDESFHFNQSAIKKPQEDIILAKI